MKFKSQDIFVWDSKGESNSPFAWLPDDDHFEIAISVLRQLGCPSYALKEIREIRKANMAIPIESRLSIMKRFFDMKDKYVWLLNSQHHKEI